MKFCPVCQTRYDEEILRFCIKDGTPLVEENPSFTTLPSETSAIEDDAGEETVIRRNPPKDATEEPPQTVSPRIIVPLKNAPNETVRARVSPQPKPPQKSNTTMLVVLTILGTLFVLGSLAGVWYLLRGGGNSTANNSNKMIVANYNAAPSNSNAFANFNQDNSFANLPVNTNTNTNTNVNLKTPTPSRTPTPTPSRTPENANTNSNANVGVNLANTNAATHPAITPSPKPSLTPTPAPPAQNVNVGVMNSRATSLPKPAYPQIAKQANASGTVTVQITIDEQGNVTSAKAVSGNALLRPSAEAAARQSRFNPVRVGDRAVTATGLLIYNFINQ